MIAELPEIQENQTEETVSVYKEKLNAVQTFMAEYLDGESAEVSNYSAYTQKVNALETFYGAKPADKPILTVQWLDKAYETESVIKAPKALAKSVKGEDLAVTVEILFEGKLVKIEKNNMFTANEAGEYTVRYLARDLQGNIAEETHTITVTKKAAVQSNQDNTGGVLLGVSLGVMAVVIAANVVLFVLWRKEK